MMVANSAATDLVRPGDEIPPQAASPRHSAAAAGPRWTDQQASIKSWYRADELSDHGLGMARALSGVRPEVALQHGVSAVGQHLHAQAISGVPSSRVAVHHQHRRQICVRFRLEASDTRKLKPVACQHIGQLSGVQARERPEPQPTLPVALVAVGPLGRGSSTKLTASSACLCPMTSRRCRRRRAWRDLSGCRRPGTE